MNTETTGFPEQIKIGPIHFEVCEVQRLTDIENTRTLWGNVRHQESRILVEAGLEGQQKLQTLLHEVFHVVLHQAGREEQAGDEGLVDTLAYGLLGVLRDNPDLMAAVANVC